MHAIGGLLLVVVELCILLDVGEWTNL